MRLATVRTPGGTRAVRLEGEGDSAAAVELPFGDVGELLARPDWRSAAGADGQRAPWADADVATLLPRPGKVICVGLNYRSHILEMGRELPEYPTLFAKFAGALTGAYDDIALPAVSQKVDWEAELGVVVGRRARRVTTEQAAAAIAGYTIVNDVSMRDWQRRTGEWLQGKTFEASTPVGPVLVTADEVGGEPGRPDLELRAEVDGDVRQQSRTSDLLFTAADVIAYVSQVITLEPGDLIATGTPGGVGAGRKPEVYLQAGQVMRTVLEGVGECRNAIVAEKT